MPVTIGGGRLRFRLRVLIIDLFVIRQECISFLHLFLLILDPATLLQRLYIITVPIHCDMIVLNHIVTLLIGLERAGGGARGSSECGNFLNF